MINLFLNRVFRAIKIDIELYEEVEKDKNATFQAGSVVVLSSLAAGVGSIHLGASNFLIAPALSLLSWYVWAYIIYFVGVKLFPEKNTKSNHGELLRTIGFSKWNIQSIFIQLVLTIGVFGIFFGNILGFFIASNITEFLNFLSQIFNISMLDVYYLDYFPSIINFQQIVWINIITFLLLLIFGFIPSNKAANTNPVNIVNKT